MVSTGTRVVLTGLKGYFRCPPEVLFGVPATPASDVYSFAWVILEVGRTHYRTRLDERVHHLSQVMTLRYRIMTFRALK